MAAVAGSYAEHVGMLNIVGTPSMSAQNKQLLLHHTLGNGDFTVFKTMAENVSGASYVLNDPEKAAETIDHAIHNAYVHQRPVYLAIPSNTPSWKLDASRLETPIDLSIEPNDPEVESEVIDTIVEMIEKAERPLVLVDACARRHDVVSEVTRLVNVSQFPVFVTPMGKGGFDEYHPRFGGVYVGSLSDPKVADVVENADLVLSVGALMSDFNTGSFSYHYHTRNIVEFHSDHTKIRSAVFPDIKMKFLLDKVTDRVAELPSKPVSDLSNLRKVKFEPVKPESPITHDWLWARLSSFLRPGDIVITETGTSAFGVVQTRYKENTNGISQILWGSIGYSVGASVGAAFAAQELDPNKRVLLFVGDGSLQVTATEFSTHVRHGLHAHLFVLNNDGYTIERLIHGEEATYNNIQMWKYHKMLDMFGSKEGQTHVVKTTGELDNLFNDSKFAEPTRTRLIEVIMPQMDAPISLVKQAKLSAETNAE